MPGQLGAWQCHHDDKRCTRRNRIARENDHKDSDCVEVELSVGNLGVISRRGFKIKMYISGQNLGLEIVI